MNKKLQVFVSSTYTDLIEERQVAVEAILDAGHIPAGMELFKAGKSQMKTILKWIDESDVYMLILGGRYGSIEEESGLSYTELEYRYALSKNMPVFAIILNDSFLFTKAASKGKEFVFEKDNNDKYMTFKKFIQTNIVKFVSNIDQISSNIHSQLNHILLDSDYNLIGWIRSDSAEIQPHDFQSTFKILQNTILYKDKNKTLNANEYLIQNIRFFMEGISDITEPIDFSYYAEFFVQNQIVENSTHDFYCFDTLRLSKFGMKYYNYIMLNFY